MYMSKLTLSILGIIATAAIVTGIIIAVKKPTQPAPESSGTNQVEQHQVATGGKKIPFSDFMKKSGSYQCTVNQNLENYSMTAQGTVYLDNGKIRGDYTASYNGKSFTGSTIIRDGFAYTWTSMMNIGWKVPVAQTDGNASSNVKVSGNTYSFNAAQIGDYDCKPWTADASKFTVPTNLTFQVVGQ